MFDEIERILTSLDSAGAFALLGVMFGVLAKLLRDNHIRTKLELKINEAEEHMQEDESTSLLLIFGSQIKKYQEETRQRASWSFFLAIISMSAGFVFVLLGSWVIIGESNLQGGAAVSAIGGAVSAYITKTFLEVHKISLTQLNKYFQHPVNNENILMAQRFSDRLDKEEMNRSYEEIIHSILALIQAPDNNTTLRLPTKK